MAAKNPRVAAATQAAKIAKAESDYAAKLKAGKVKSVVKTKNEIAKKTGVWPNGMTN